MFYEEGDALDTFVRPQRYTHVLVRGKHNTVCFKKTLLTLILFPYHANIN